MEERKKESKKSQGVLTKEVSRRDFLKTSAVGAAGLTMGSMAFAPFTYGAKKPIKLGLLAEYTVAATAYGYWFDKAAKGAVAKLNADGGIDGRAVKLITADTKCNPAESARQFRKLVLQDKVDFVFGSVITSVHKAIFPVAAQFNMPFFGGGAMAASLTGKDTVPEYVRIHTHARMQAQAGWKWGFDNLGKKWTILVADYGWGQSLAEEFGKRIRAAGGATQVILAPKTTKDFVPYLQKVESDSEVLFTAFLGAAALGVLRQTVELGLHERLKRYSVICTTDGVGMDQVGKEAAGAYYLSYYPRYADQVPKELQPYDKAYRQACGITDDGRDVNDRKKVITGSHCWSCWEIPFMLKLAVEQSGWKDSKKNADLAKAFCNLKVSAGPWFPQGDLVMREQDHQGFHDHYLVKVDKNLKLNVIDRIPKEKTMYDSPIDLRKKA